MFNVTYSIFKRACKNGDLRNVETFFDNFNSKFEILEMRNMVAQEGHLNILEYFYRRGVDMNVDYNHDTPLRIAARRGWVDIINFLLAVGVDINFQNDSGWTALMSASAYEKIDVVDIFLATGQCDVNLKTNWGETALTHVVFNGNLGIIDRLILHGANYYYINDDNGANLLHYATNNKYVNNIDVLQRILSLDLDVNHQNNNGWTPLMFAVKFDKKEMVEILLDYGADPQIENNDGNIASDMTDDSEIKNLFLNF